MSNNPVTLFLATCAVLAAQSSVAGTIPKDQGDWYLNGATNIPDLQNQAEYSDKLSENNPYYTKNFSLSLGYRRDEDEDVAEGLSIATEISANSSKSIMMLNASYGIGNENGFTPYLGVGAGMENKNSESLYNIGQNSNEINAIPAYQAIAGFSYISDSYPSAIMRMGYKYFATIGKIYNSPIQEPGKNNSSTQNVQAGIQVNF